MEFYSTAAERKFESARGYITFSYPQENGVTVLESIASWLPGEGLKLIEAMANYLGDGTPVSAQITEESTIQQLKSGGFFQAFASPMQRIDDPEILSKLNMVKLLKRGGITIESLDIQHLEPQGKHYFYVFVSGKVSAI